ncbi:MAG TPA: hypothetical protein VF840_05835 [Terriglobales bacterium]
MKTKVCIFLLAASLAAYAQGRSGGTAGGGHMGGPPSGAGSMGAGAGSMGASHGNEASTGNASRPSDVGKQSPDTILSRNTKLSSKLDSLLPKGTTAQQACSGFKNLGQCVAAIHVSHNLGISFDDLKAKMTGANSESLGKAIHDLKPDGNAKAEAKKGQKQADQDLSQS